ncbi:hypothetical protein V494_00094 [Pseudogymnoascus sp. VKM F-4513 (FW-928)]|nr:hypothetical protein V494_00094 [Pseudogymnoascus sp. VKM F-4513 (FW-928)]
MIVPSFLTLGFLATAVVAAADPRTCNRNDAKLPLLDEKNFKLTYSANSHASKLSKHLKTVSMTQVLTNANRQLVKKNPSTGSGKRLESWAWNSGDDKTAKYFPQGISGSGDALGAGKWEGHDVWAVSWYQKEAKAGEKKKARISFIDRKTHKYRHVLLVEPSADDDFKEVSVHAGGIAWYGDALYVVDTDNGLRVFNVSSMFSVGAGDRVGKDPKTGKYSANNYAYVLPQMWKFDWKSKQPDSPFRHSWVSLDRSTTPDSLIIGEYQESDAKTPIRVVRYPLDYTTRKLKTTSNVATATYASCINILKMQGGMSWKNKFYFTRSASPAADLWTWVSGKAAKLSKGWLPSGAEDLSYNESKGECVAVSVVVAMDLLGPLTTVFTPPASCDILTVHTVSNEYTTTEYVTNTGGSTVSSFPTVTTTTAVNLEKFNYLMDGGCYPPGMTARTAYYSPGRCPSAWHGVLTTAQNNETTVQCCPPSFTLSSANKLCLSTVTGFPTIPVIVYTDYVRVNSVPTPSRIQDDLVFAEGVTVRFKEGDFPDTTSSPTLPTSRTNPAETKDSNSDSDSDSNSSSDLSLGAKVGVGVGVPVAVLIIAGLVYYFFWRGRKAKTPDPISPVPVSLLYANYPASPSSQQYQFTTQTDAGTGYNAPMSEMYTPGFGITGGQVPGNYYVPEMGGSVVSEVPGSQGNWAERAAPGPAELYPENGALGNQNENMGVMSASSTQNAAAAAIVTPTCHPSLPHCANRPEDTQPTGPPPLDGAEPSSSTSAVSPVGESLLALNMRPAAQQYMREHAEAAKRRHNEELERARGDPCHPLYEHAPVFTYDPQSTFLEMYYANLQLIAQVELSCGRVYPYWALVDASQLGPYELQLELLGQSNKLVLLMGMMRQEGGYGDVGYTQYIDENGCVQPSGEELWWIVKRGLDGWIGEEIEP